MSSSILVINSDHAPQPQQSVAVPTKKAMEVLRVSSNSIPKFDLPKTTKTFDWLLKEDVRELEWIEDMFHGKTQKPQEEPQGTEDVDLDEEMPLRDHHHKVPSTVFVSVDGGRDDCDCKKKYQKEILLDNLNALEEALRCFEPDDFDEDCLSEGDVEDDELDFDDDYQELLRTQPLNKTLEATSNNPFRRELLLDNFGSFQAALAAAAAGKGNEMKNNSDSPEDDLSEGDLEDMDDDDDLEENDDDTDDRSDLTDADFDPARHLLGLSNYHSIE
jgi:hypothetical protein